MGGIFILGKTVRFSIKEENTGDRHRTTHTPNAVCGQLFKGPGAKKIAPPIIQMARRHTRKAARKTHRKHRKSQKQQRKH
jgi:hypothetical protein